MHEFGRKKNKSQNGKKTSSIDATLDYMDATHEEKASDEPDAQEGYAGREFQPKANDDKSLPKKVTYHEAHHRKGNPPPDFAKIRNAALFQLLPKLDYDAAANLSRDELIWQLRDVIRSVLIDMKLNLNHEEEDVLEVSLVDELLGLGPLEVLLADPDVDDILVNGPKQIFVERHGKLDLTDIELRNESHVRNIADRICSTVGRHVDTASPLVDTRLADGSRVNIIIPPLSLRGTAISIRKFSVKPFTLPDLIENGTLSQDMADYLEAAAASKLNIIISGGTGSGKTTLLNVLSQSIPEDERIITIEDSAELNLKQPHVLPLESRPTNTDGEGEVSIRELVVNALRMRPDRIIVGEVRGGEVMDMLQAMNTGHEGSMGTVHANGATQSLTRLENMASMAGFTYPIHVIRRQMAEALHLIVQIARMKDGKRRITSINEIIGIEGEEINMQELFKFTFIERDKEGNLLGEFNSADVESVNMETFRMFGYDKQVLTALNRKGADHDKA